LSGFTLTGNNVETRQAALARFSRAFVSASTFRAIAGDASQAENALTSKSFLVLFFKKELLPFFLVSPCQSVQV
jgi:hypothetical protein